MQLVLFSQKMKKKKMPASFFFFWTLILNITPCQYEIILNTPTEFKNHQKV